MFQIKRKMVNTIKFWFDSIRFTTVLSEIRGASGGVLNWAHEIAGAHQYSYNVWSVSPRQRNRFAITFKAKAS